METCSRTRVVNLEIPGAVTVIPVDQFGRVIDRRAIRQFDRQRFAGIRPVLDPLTLTPLRNAVVHSAWGRGKIDLPPGIAKKLHERPVFVVADARDSRFRPDPMKALRVERVPEKFRKQELKFARRGDDGRGNGSGGASGRGRCAGNRSISWRLRLPAAIGRLSSRCVSLSAEQRKQAG